MIELDLHGRKYRLLFTRASNEEAPPANITVASGWVREKQDFDADYVVYVSRSVPVDDEHSHIRERNAYFDPIYLMIER